MNPSNNDYWVELLSDSLFAELVGTDDSSAAAAAHRCAQDSLSQLFEMPNSVASEDTALVFHRKMFHVLCQNSTLVPPTELSLRQSRDPSIVASFSLVRTRIRSFYVVVLRVQSSQEVVRKGCETLNLKHSAHIPLPEELLMRNG